MRMQICVHNYNNVCVINFVQFSSVSLTWIVIHYTYNNGIDFYNSIKLIKKLSNLCYTLIA